MRGVCVRRPRTLPRHILRVVCVCVCVCGGGGGGAKCSPSGLMDKASVSGAEDCGFESHLGYVFCLLCARPAIAEFVNRGVTTACRAWPRTVSQHGLCFAFASCCRLHGINLRHRSCLKPRACKECRAAQSVPPPREVGAGQKCAIRDSNPGLLLGKQQ